MVEIAISPNQFLGVKPDRIMFGIGGLGLSTGGVIEIPQTRMPRLGMLRKRCTPEGEISIQSNISPSPRQYGWTISSAQKKTIMELTNE